MIEMMNETYNGWTNYETWCVHLWLTVDEATYNKALDLIDDEELGIDQDIAIERFVSSIINIDFDPCLHDRTGLGINQDLAEYALQNVNWTEITEALKGE